MINQRIQAPVRNHILRLSLVVIVVGLCSCESYHRNKTYASIPEDYVAQGEVLAMKYCQGCHSMPDPSMLDVTSWEQGVLPQMGPRLGIFRHNFKDYPSLRGQEKLPSGYYPSSPLLTSSEWQRILDYYLATSPDSLPGQDLEPIKQNLQVFQSLSPEMDYDSAAIVYAGFDTTGTARRIVLSDVKKQQLLSFDAGLQIVDSVKSTASIVDILYQPSRLIACDIGILNPTNEKVGRSLLIARDSGVIAIDKAQTMIEGLARPVDITAADLNKDRVEDYIVCEFGHLSGSLSWLEGIAGGKYRRHVLARRPGAIKTWVTDANEDGIPDIWVLFTQSQEGIVLFEGIGDGQFRQREVLSFPAVQGSTYFELADFNADGKLDILYTSGDNADYSMVLKPYHGVYVYLNNGSNVFRQAYFFPINGCFKAIPRDFDRDGDLDIAAISFFADYQNQPEEGFVYLENKGKLEFEPSGFSGGISGRWLTMEAGDLDNDGRIDLVLGNFSLRPSVTTPRVDWKKGSPFIFLRNISK